MSLLYTNELRNNNCSWEQLTFSDPNPPLVLVIIQIFLNSLLADLVNVHPTSIKDNAYCNLSLNHFSCIDHFGVTRNIVDGISGNGVVCGL